MKTQRNRRKGNDPRGKSKDRQRRKLWIIGFYGNANSMTVPCVHCEKELTLQTLTQDRIVPGGSYARTNIQPQLP